MSKRSDMYKRYAADARARTGFDCPFLKFTSESARWSTGKDEQAKVLNDRTLLADVPSVAIGHRKFTREKQVVYAVVAIDDDNGPPLRASLGETDEREWQPGDNGRKRDPWNPILVVPFVDPETSEDFAYVAETIGGHDAAADLMDAFARASETDLGENDDVLPRVKLCSGSRIAGNGRKYSYPIFEIVGWEPRPAGMRRLRPPPLPLPAPPRVGATAATAAAAADDDGIPF
jgi:hypothetical protein